MNTKKYFGTDGIRGKVGQHPITADFILKLGWALGKALTRERSGRNKVLVGKDTRISGYMFESALEAGLSAAGVDIQLLGPMPTPAIAYLTRTLRAQAGIVISASHNPYHDNGIKFFCEEGQKLSDELELHIEALLEQTMVTVDSAELGRASRVVDAAGRYIEFCKGTLPANASLKGMKIVVDCAHGATYHVAPKVYAELGAEVIEIGSDPNGLNINDGYGSTQPGQLAQTVLNEKADLGIALDGDGDRVVFVDHQGEIVDGDELLYIIAKERLRLGERVPGVVGTLMSNLGLELAMKELDIEFVRSKVGDRHVMAALRERGWTLGGEPSGHLLSLDISSTGDGIIASLQVLSALKNQNVSLNQLKKGMKKYPQVMKNIPLQQNQLSKELLESNSISAAIEKIRSNLQYRGRLVVRASGTEPVIRVMLEGEERQELEKMGQYLAEVIAEQSSI